MKFIIDKDGIALNLSPLMMMGPFNKGTQTLLMYPVTSTDHRCAKFLVDVEYDKFKSKLAAQNIVCAQWKELQNEPKR
jgi:hypothetical protein